jgi:hypothetical protein
VPVLTLADLALGLDKVAPTTFGFRVLSRQAPPVRAVGLLIDGNRDPEAVVADLTLALKQL